ncbi:MAG: HAD family hydrolase [Myxococcota bacterium]
MIRGIVFDLFDTLVDQNHERLRPVEVDGGRVGATMPALHACARDRFGVDLSILAFAERVREMDQALRADTIEQGIELSTLDRFTALGTRLGQPDVLDFAQALTDVHMGALYAACTVPEHHENILVALGVEYRMALCSNFSHAATARAVLAEARFDAHLASVVISEEVGIRKPRAEIFQAVIDELGIPPEELLHVGDNLVADVQGAAALGIRTVWLTRKVQDPEGALAAYGGPRPDFALEDLMDLPVLAARLSV